VAESRWTNELDNIPENVKKIFAKKIDDYGQSLYSSFICGESPIEQILIIRFCEFLRCKKRYEMEFLEGLVLNELYLQKTIEINKRKYRVDFLIHMIDQKTKQELNIIIECDGHDFHEKTKEQAQKDKQRDRDCTTAGYIVLRYTGSEICNNDKIAMDIFNSIREIMLQRRNGR
jgi:very-short-patch-repair endonuclease